MKLEFKRRGNDFVDAQGTIVDSGLISAFDHQYNADGSGWVELPNVITNSTLNYLGSGKEEPSHDLKSKKQQAEKPYVELPRGMFQPFVGDRFPQDKVLRDKVLRDKLLKAYFEQISNAQVVPREQPLTLEDFVDAESKDLFPTPSTVHNIMISLGFQPRSNNNGVVYRWFHPLLGEDFEHNWLLLDAGTDSLQSLVPKLFRSGVVAGQRQIRKDVRAALDI